MAITETNLPGNGTAGPFTYTFPALEAGDIYVSVDGVVKTVTTDYSLNFVDKQITFLTTPYPTVSNVIRIYRVTDDADLAATFYSGAAIRATDLNTNFTQGLYVTQESNREAATAISTAGSAVTTANAATATANSAVSTANAATATANTALSNSSAAVSTANTASSNASAAVSTANTASSNASAAVSTANTASSNATTAVSTANAATATANSAASDAATAISTANGAVTTANNAAADAATAISTANTASSNASAAVSTANTASSNATSAVNTANSALSTANAAASAVANAILYDIVANVAAIPASPANNDAVEVTDSTGIESFTPLTSIPGGFAGNSGLSVRIVYTTTGNTWTWIQYFPNDPETRYLKEAVTTSDTAPVSPSDGDLWYDSVGGRTYVYYDDGDTSQWVDTSPQGSGVSDAISEGNTSAEVIDTGSDGRFVVTTEGSERLRITSAGLVGIGTNSPGSYNSEADDLVIYNSGDGGITIATGSSTGQNKIYFAKGTTGSEQYQGYIVYNQSATSNGSMVFGVGGSNKVAITEAGNVGIGITSPSARLNIAEGNANAVSTTSTDVNRVLLTDTSGSTSAGAGYSLDFEGTYGGLGRIAISKSNSATAGTSRDTGAFRLFLNQNLGEDSYAAFTEALTIDSNGTDQGLIYRFRGTEQIRVDNSGRLLVGTSSTSSNAIAIVQGNPTLTSAGRLYLTRRNETTASNDELGILHFAGSAHNSAAEIGSQRDGGTWTTGSSHPTRLTFSTTANGASTPTERLRIDSSGRVGIGATPSTFDGNGDNLVISSSGATGITIDATSSTNSSIHFADGPTGTEAYRGYIVYTHSQDAMFFGTSGTERARIDSSGRLLVGTSSTSGFVTDGGKFYLRNSGECMSIYNDAGTGWNMRHNATSNGGTFFFISFAAAGTGVGGITSNSTTTTYGTTSDYRLKENIEPITDSVDRLKQLNPCKFNFIAAPERTVDGFLAHEVQTHVPEAVVGKKDAVDQSGEPVYQNIDQSKLVPLLTAALQEAVARIEAQDTTIASLEARLTALEGGTN
jgi:hypothetical protein